MEIDDNINQFKSENIYINQSIYLLHFPKGKIVEFSLGVIKNIYTNSSKIEYFCAKGENSYGCPIVRSENNKVIGIHNYIDKYSHFNIGTLIKDLIQDFNKEKIIPIKDDKEDKLITIKYKVDKNKKIKIFGTQFIENN